MRCANTEALNRYEEKIAKEEANFERFNDEILGHLRLIESSIDAMQRIGENYCGIDYDEVIKERVKEFL